MSEQIKDGGLLGALNGPRGDLDAWLEEMSEDEVRSAIRSIISPTETLRDKFAAKAMQGLLSQSAALRLDSPPYELAAKVAYGYADAMLAAREAKS